MVSYASLVTWNIECPHCAFHIGIWMERRGSLRIKSRHPLTIQNQDACCPGYTLDHSDGGLKIAYRGGTFSPRQRITVEIKDLNLSRTAEIVWTCMVDDTVSHAGIVVI